MKFAQGDLVLIPFPFSDLSRKKVRPALIISNKKFNLFGRDFLLVPLTSIIKRDNYSVKIDQSNLVSGNLVKSSIIKVSNVFAVDKNKIVFKIGTLDKQIFNKVKKLFYSLV